MSTGHKIIPVRIDAELLAYIDSTIQRVNEKRTQEPFTRSTFIRAALREKLAHYKRSLRPVRKATTEEPPWIAEDTNPGPEPKYGPPHPATL